MKKTFLILCFLSTVLANTALFAEPAKFQGITDLHNAIRAGHSQPPLKWSDKLASYASQWVNYLASSQNCTMMHRPNAGDSKFKQIYGENLFWASPEIFSSGKSTIQPINIKDVFDAWAEEEQFYNYQKNTCESGKDCGHYTQIVWHETKEIGCAMAVCPDKSQIWACNYSPRGNYLGEWPY